VTLNDQADSPVSSEVREGLRSTGDPEMDAQHLRILQALQRLDESLRGPFPLATLSARLKQLEDFVLEHFQDEEARLEQAGYVLLEAHRVEHEVMVKRCHEVMDQFSSPDSPPLTSLGETLISMFLSHIEGVDMHYAPFLERARLG
jgi:hemerythrin-like metal-binding protein